MVKTSEVSSQGQEPGIQKDPYEYCRHAVIVDSLNIITTRLKHFCRDRQSTDMLSDSRWERRLTYDMLH